MHILAFETSCDDTSLALFRDDSLLSLVTRSQIREHAATGWVVPEVAARLHANVVFDVLEEVLIQAQVRLEEFDLIAYTSEPGLAPSLLVGKTVASTLSKLLKKPLVPIDHIMAHIFSNLLERHVEEIPFPAVCLTVSGGHNELYMWRSLFDLEKIGQTHDDAAGEAFDKVAKALGLGYPGGPIIAKLASEYPGKPSGIFPRVLLEKNTLDFSFSGLKSAVKREIDRLREIEWWISESTMRMIAFEFEDCVTDILVAKTMEATRQYGPKSIVLAGGVSANDMLREKLEHAAKKAGCHFIAPMKKVYSQDNAAMVGILAYYKACSPK